MEIFHILKIKINKILLRIKMKTHYIIVMMIKKLKKLINYKQLMNNVYNNW